MQLGKRSHESTTISSFFSPKVLHIVDVFIICVFPWPRSFLDENNISFLGIAKVLGTYDKKDEFQKKKKPTFCQLIISGDFVQENNYYEYPDLLFLINQSTLKRAKVMKHSTVIDESLSKDDDFAIEYYELKSGLVVNRDTCIQKHHVPKNLKWKPADSHIKTIIYDKRISYAKLHIKKEKYVVIPASLSNFLNEPQKGERIPNSFVRKLIVLPIKEDIKVEAYYQCLLEQNDDGDECGLCYFEYSHPFYTDRIFDSVKNQKKKKL